MTILVVGASGATGRQLIEQLLIQGHNVKAVVRYPEKLPEAWKSNERIKIISASLLDLSDKEMIELTLGCHSIARRFADAPQWWDRYLGMGR